jgi:hypothetical protein
MLNYFHIYSHLFLHQQTPCICPPNSKLSVGRDIIL